MTYPPQPEQPYGQQPDPYGQGGQPPSGGFPRPDPQQYPGQQYAGQQYPNQPYQGQPRQDQPTQGERHPGQPHPAQQYPGQPYQGQSYQGQQYPQQGGYGQQQHPQYGQVGGFGGPPPPPKQKKTGLWIGLILVIVGLAGFAVTAFVVPGFLLSKDTGAQGADSTAQALADALNKKDGVALTSLKCGKAGANVDAAIAEISKVRAAKLNGPLTKVTDAEYTANLDVTTGSSKPQPYLGTVLNESGKWCWKNIERASSSKSSAVPTTPSR